MNKWVQPDDMIKTEIGPIRRVKFPDGWKLARQVGYVMEAFEFGVNYPYLTNVRRSVYRPCNEYGNFV